MTPAPAARNASGLREYFRQLRDSQKGQLARELNNPPVNPATGSRMPSHTSAYPSPPERHHGDARRQPSASTASPAINEHVIPAKTHKKDSQPSPATDELRSETDKRGLEHAVDTGGQAGECPLDDRVIYGLVLRAFAGERELEFVEVNRRCRSAGYPGGAQAVTLAIVRKYVGVRNGWNGQPYTAYLTGRMPIQ